MDKKVYSGKTYEEAVDAAKIDLQELEEDLIIHEISNEKGGLFKSSKVEIEVISKRDILEYMNSVDFNLKNRIVKKDGVK